MPSFPFKHNSPILRKGRFRESSDLWIVLQHLLRHAFLEETICQRAAAFVIYDEGFPDSTNELTTEGWKNELLSLRMNE